MAIDELESGSRRPATRTRAPAIVEVLPWAPEAAPDTPAWPDGDLEAPPGPGALRVAIVGGGVESLPADLARLVSEGPAAAEPSTPSSADVLIVCPQDEGEEHLGPDLSALGRACAAAVRAAVPGQTVVMTSASYVGCTRDLLVAPLARRGLVVGKDIHVAVSPEPVHPANPDRPLGRSVGGATAACARVAAATLERVGPVHVAESLEAAEAASLSSPRRLGFGPTGKRLLDLVGVAIGIAVAWPVMIAIAIAILVDSGRPIFFSQERVGLNGRRFKFRKFRTMTPDAEGRLREVLHLNGIHGPGFQIENDPRVTRIGRFLRASSLDELPQLWNVVRGEMSLVGPRPAPLVEVAAYRPWHLRRLAVKPGITGLAQVRARKYLEFDVKAGIDLQYIDHWSLLLDVEILLRTVPAVLRFTGR